MSTEGVQSLLRMEEIGRQLERKRILALIQNMSIEVVGDSAKTVEQILILIAKK